MSDQPAGATGPPAQGAGATRQATGTTLGMFGPVVGIWLISLATVVPIAIGLGGALGSRGAVPALLILAYTLAGGLLLLRPVEETMGRLLFTLREPTPIEREKLWPRWQEVCQAAGADPEHYLLRIDDSPGINASATAAHFVAVTRQALELPDRQLAGVLAHELGHHLDLHPVALSLSWWYLLPSVLANWLLVLVMRITATIIHLLGNLTGWVYIVGWPVLVVLWMTRGLLTLFVRTTQFFASMLSRPAEYAADRHATSFGYGRALMELFQSWIDQGLDTPQMRGSMIQRAFLDHPPLDKRSQAIGKLLE